MEGNEMGKEFRSSVKNLDVSVYVFVEDKRWGLKEKGSLGVHEASIRHTNLSFANINQLWGGHNFGAIYMFTIFVSPPIYQTHFFHPTLLSARALEEGDIIYPETIVFTLNWIFLENILTLQSNKLPHVRNKTAVISQFPTTPRDPPSAGLLWTFVLVHFYTYWKQKQILSFIQVS